MTPSCLSVDAIATRPLERIVANVNFTSVESITGARMWLAIVDRYSEYVEVFTLKSIPKALGKVVAFIRQAEQFLPGKPKCKFVRAEHGNEFMGALERYCERSGIVYERHLRYASNQDSPVEMVHHALEKVAVALLEHSALPEVLWPYALQMAAMYHNFSVSTATLRVPVEEFIGQKVNSLLLEYLGVLLSPQFLKCIGMVLPVLAWKEHIWVLPFRIRFVLCLRRTLERSTK